MKPNRLQMAWTITQVLCLELSDLDMELWSLAHDIKQGLETKMREKEIKQRDRKKK